MLEILLLVGSVQLIALISPGPDFVLILRQSIAYGKNIAGDGSMPDSIRACTAANRASFGMVGRLPFISALTAMPPHATRR
ncbi:MAG: hypothetical protein ACNA7Y_06595, partial [Gammaproteobacteria bacterium]